MKKKARAGLIMAALVLISTLAWAVNIFEAVATGDLEEVKKIVAQDPIEVNNQDNWLQISPLQIAADRDYLEIVNFLISQGAKLDAQDFEGDTALHFAAAGGHLEGARLLIQKGANLNLQNQQGETPLYLAVLHHQAELVMFLLEKGADPNLPDELDLNPVELATAQGDADLIKVFADRGLKADPGLARQKYSRITAREYQSEARAYLKAIYTAQLIYQGMNNTYGTSFEMIDEKIEGKNRYAYFLADDVMPATQGGPYQLPKGVKAKATDIGFIAVAVGNIDDDPTLDVWTINDRNDLKNLVDDVVK